MTSVIMIAPLNAANFESGNAPDTQALFANGEGGSEWREPAGGGGAVLFDDVLIVTSSQRQTEFGAAVPITITFTLNSVPVNYACAGVMIDEMTASFMPTGSAGGTIQRQGTLWIVTTIAGQLSCDLEVFDIPSNSSLQFLTPSGNITTAVPVAWNKV